MTNLSKTNPASPTQRSGFTLIELLVVVSIIALLISILLPSLKKAKDEGKKAVCLANMKSIGNASIVYAGYDENDLAIPAHALIGEDERATGKAEWGGKSGHGSINGPSITGIYATSQKRGPATRPMNTFMFKAGFADNFAKGAIPPNTAWYEDFNLKLDVYKCPGDTGWVGGRVVADDDSEAWRASRMTAYDFWGNSYHANTALIGVTGGSGPCIKMSNGIFLKPLSRVPSPQNTVMYWEAPARDSALQNYNCAMPNPDDLTCTTGCGGECGWIKAPYENEYPITGWHGRKDMHVAVFGDAHAAYTTFHGMTRPTPSLPIYPPVIVDCTTGLSDPGSGCSTWACVINRGPGWQTETLPSPPICTTVPCTGEGGGHD